MHTVVSAGIYPHPPIMVPEVGGRETDKVRASVKAMEEAARRAGASGADMLLVISPHGPAFHDAIAILAGQELKGSLARFGAPQVSMSFDNDLEAVQAIVEEAGRHSLPVILIDSETARSYRTEAGLDHGALVPLYFFEKAGLDLPLVHITFGFLPPRQLFEFGRAAAAALAGLGRKTAVVASGDLSHRLNRVAPAGYSPAGRKFDERLTELLRAYDVPAILNLEPELVESAGECGYRSLLICLGMLDGTEVKPEILSYEGPFGVGYLVADLTPGNLTAAVDAKQSESEYVRLARQALEAYVKTGKIINPPDKSPLANTRAGAFVSLKVNGHLRGCIGTIEPAQENLAQEIIENAISAGSYDPRFRPVQSGELSTLTYSVDVLSAPEKVTGPEELDHIKYGVIVESGRRKGLLLPDLEGVESVEEQLAIALQKAGIRPGDNYSIYRFTVTRHY